jgi:hypothetical protein
MSVSDPMAPSSPLDPAPIVRAHPLALLLVERLRARPGARVLDFCTGSGRNAGALRAAGYDVTAIPDAAADRSEFLMPGSAPFAAAISTHGFLHGTRAAIAARTARIADRLESEAPLYAVFGSVRDARFGSGRRLADETFAPLDGDERGVAHTYFTRVQLDELLRVHYIVERLEETGVDGVAGTWAHRESPLSNAVHWFVIARRR